MDYFTIFIGVILFWIVANMVAYYYHPKENRLGPISHFDADMNTPPNSGDDTDEDDGPTTST